MGILASLSITSQALLLAAAPLAATAIAGLWLRRLGAPLSVRLLLAGGLGLWVLAAGGLTWMIGRSAQVLVMVDLSASTRSAEYRDPQALRQRLGQLLGDRPYEVVYFADEQQVSPQAQAIENLSPGRTVFRPPAAEAVVLLSDGQFAVPVFSPPVYAVIDPRLKEARDSAVTLLERRGQQLVAGVRHQGAGPQGVVLSAQPGPTTQRWVEAGQQVVSMDLPLQARRAGARVSGSDPWPENDALALALPPPQMAGRWWVGGQAPPGWIGLEQLPAELAEYLTTSIIVLENVPASALTAPQQQRLAHYVRNLGGALVILGGQRAYAAGDYGGSVLEMLSPLSSHPPTPAMQWIVLLDASGSMAAPAGPISRWELQAQALQRLLPHLPAKDSLSVGGFSQELRWWTQGRSVGQALRQRLPPGDQRPGGPTNLEAALAATIAQVEGDAPKQLLLVSDTEAQIDDPESLARGLKRTQIRLHVLAIGQGKAGALLKNLAEGSGGGFMQSLEPRGWTDSLRQLARGAMGDRLMRRTVRAQLASELNWPGGLSIDLWNRVWLKETALLLGRVDEPDGAPLMGRWQLGQGVVLAAAFGPPRELALALADSVARPPRDPRFAVSVSAQSQVRIGVEAVDQGASMNGLALELELRGDDEVRTHALQQSGPGQYEIVLPASRAPQVGVLRLGQRVIDQVVLPGRYPAEFERIGIDEQALHQLALRSGGAVVWPWQKQPLKLRVRQGRMGLMPWLAAAGGLLIGAGLIRWRYC